MLYLFETAKFIRGIDIRKAYVNWRKEAKLSKLIRNSVWYLNATDLKVPSSKTWINQFDPENYNTNHQAKQELFGKYFINEFIPGKVSILDIRNKIYRLKI